LLVGKLTGSDATMTTPEPKAPAARGPINIAAFLLTFAFVWLVFDNLSLA